MRAAASKTLYPSSSRAQVGQAREAWSSGDRLEAGRLLYEALLPADRPRWAGRMLGLVAFRMDAPACVERVSDIAFDRDRWPEGHEAFREVREQLLQQERLETARDERLYRLLGLTELVAKVAYNTSGFPAPFDFHAGWRIPQRLFECLELLGDANLKAEAEHLLLEV